MKKYLLLLFVAIPTLLMTGCGDSSDTHIKTNSTILDIFFNELSGLIFICLLLLAIGIMGCYFGFRLKRLIIASSGLITGLVFGLLMESAGLAVMLCLIGAVLFFALYKLKLVVFYSSFMNFTLFTGVSLLIMIGENAGDFLMILAVIVGIPVGVMSITNPKPTYIITTSVAYGLLSALIFTTIVIISIIEVDTDLIETFKTMLIISSLLFIVSGLIVQIKTNNGLSDDSDYYYDPDADDQRR